MIISFIIDRIEGDKAVLKSDENESVIWPLKKLPAGSKEGSALVFSISDDKIKEQNGKKLAKDILNEILNPEDQEP